MSGENSASVRQMVSGSLGIQSNSHTPCPTCLQFTNLTYKWIEKRHKEVVCIPFSTWHLFCRLRNTIALYKQHMLVQGNTSTEGVGSIMLAPCWSLCMFTITHAETLKARPFFRTKPYYMILNYITGFVTNQVQVPSTKLIWLIFPTATQQLEGMA